LPQKNRRYAARATEVDPMLDTKAPTHYRWDDMTAEKLKGSITRRLITGDSMMIAEVRLAKGELVPKHAHHNEQITFITSGALQFKLGEDGEHEVVVHAGEVLVIPSNTPHSAYALEDTVDIDIFSPPREDWLDGSDAYLRG
jgi:quercetin dioxygenase-like cupin family protein